VSDHRSRALELCRAAWPDVVGDAPASCEQLDAALVRAGVAWRVWPGKPSSYEAAVAEGRIPTRERSWHDTFNVLAFISFPRSKAALHGRTLSLQQGRERGSPRTREEDALALIDEAALLFAGSRVAIEQFDLARHAGDLASLDAIVRAHAMHVYVFGHALLEHVALARPPIGAGVLVLALDGELSRTRIDAALAERVAAGAFPRPQLSPSLPWPDPLIESWLRPLASG
jgi:hypothetical protein